jgi:uncharacterized protein
MRLLTIFILLTAQLSLAQSPVVDQPLPPLKIAELGEMQLEDDEIRYVPWSSERAVEKVHVVQYFAGSLSASEIFEPFTDALQETYQSGSYHVTTIINLDDALWGTSGFVVSEVSKNKKKFPQSTMVLDEEGNGKASWDLGKRGAGLIILDPSGIVQYFTREALGEQDMQAALALVGRFISQ